jgi:SAM-dependent methyltransferase
MSYRQAQELRAQVRKGEKGSPVVDPGLRLFARGQTELYIVIVVELTRPRILDIGCGRNKVQGAIGIDKNTRSNADVICDLDHFPYPFSDSSFDRIYIVHVIEPVGDVMQTMEEIHRLLVPDGVVYVVTPHYTDFSSFTDPTHRSHLSSFSFRYFGNQHGGFAYYSDVRFRELKVRVKLLRLWRYFGFELLINRWARIRLIWEYYACFLIRGKLIEWELQAVKQSGASRS